MLNRMLRYLFFLLIVRPIVLIVIGLNVRHRQRLPKTGPALIVANHNSHLDALTLMTLFPMRQLHQVQPVAAMDYFMKNKLLAWFSTKIIGIIPLNRKIASARTDPLAGMSEAIQNDRILILFPEGSRGEPEQIEEFKTGVAHIVKRHPDVPVVPIFLHGLGKVLPRGEGILVPFFCDVFIGETLQWDGDRKAFMQDLTDRIQQLSDECPTPQWD